MQSVFARVVKPEYNGMAMSDNLWMHEDVSSYHMAEGFLKSVKFLGEQQFSPPTHFSQQFLDSPMSRQAEDMLDNKYHLMARLYLATGDNHSSKFANLNFTFALLQVLGYKGGDIVLHFNYTIPYDICDDNLFHARTGMC